MAKPSILVLYNEPMLPLDHPNAYSENSVVEIADMMIAALSEEGYRIGRFGLGTDPTVLWNELKKRKPDVVFNLFEGNLDNTETESFVAGLLDWSGIPYTGSPPAARRSGPRSRALSRPSSTAPRRRRRWPPPSTTARLRNPQPSPCVSHYDCCKFAAARRQRLT